MENLTEEQAQSIWDNKTELFKVLADGVYQCWRMYSSLDTKTYDVDTIKAGISCSESTSIPEMETLMITY